MDEAGPDNRRHRVEYPKLSPWNLMSHYQMRDQNAIQMHAKINMLYDEKDAAIRERDRAMAEKKAALDERDAAIRQRDAAIIQRDNVVTERDNAIAALQFHESTMNAIFSMRGGTKRTEHPTDHHPNNVHSEHSSREECISNTFPTSVVPYETPPSKKGTRTKTNKNVEFQCTTKLPKNVKKINEDLNMQVTTDGSKAELDAQDIGSGKQIWFDESSMQVPICSCTGVPRQCYKWGNGGWQSSCCTTSLSVYPLPQMPNKRHARMGGRKMSGSVFSRLLTRVVAAGHDLSVPLDLKSYWAKHGTNRYITIK